MSNQRSTFQSASYSFSSSTVNGQTRSQSQTTYSDPAGTRVQRSSQEPGQARRDENFTYDNAGRLVKDQGAQGRIEDVTDREQDAKDREYEERMEDEYAKREGGA